MTNYRRRRRRIGRDKRQSLHGSHGRVGAERWPWMRRRRPYQDANDAAFQRLICYLPVQHRPKRSLTLTGRPHRAHQAREFRLGAKSPPLVLRILCGIITRTTNVTTLRVVTFGYLLLQIRLSSVTFVRPTQGVETFGNISSPFCTLASI